jgi:hypothetical protein
MPSKSWYWRKKEGKIEVIGRQGRKCKKLLDDVKEKEDTVN